MSFGSSVEVKRSIEIGYFFDAFKKVMAHRTPIFFF
jgi:hypothetical protein